MKHPTLIAAAALIAVGACLPAHAASEAEWTRGAATGVGRWIAAQGNLALREIQMDLKANLRQRIELYTPAFIEAAQSRSTDAAAPTPYFTAE